MKEYLRGREGSRGDIFEMFRGGRGAMLQIEQDGIHDSHDRIQRGKELMGNSTK